MLRMRPTGTLAASGGNIEGLAQLGELGLALALSALIGLEREIRQKSAGLRTHCLVGVGAGLFMLVSKYGFSDVLVANKIVVDPSRVAAQIVTGIGFLGAGLIFVRRGSVRGLTTAASIWVTAAIGAAAGAALPLLAVVATVIYLVVALAFPLFSRRLPNSRWAVSTLRVRYPDGHGMLREILRLVTERGFSLAEMDTAAVEDVRRDGEPGSGPEPERHVEVALQVFGRGSLNDLAATLSELPGVRAVRVSDANVESE